MALVYINLSNVSVLGAVTIRLERDTVSCANGEEQIVGRAKRLFDKVLALDGFDHEKVVILFPDDGGIVTSFIILWFERFRTLPKVALSFAGTHCNPPCPKSPTNVLELAGPN